MKAAALPNLLLAMQQNIFDEGRISSKGLLSVTLIMFIRQYMA